MVNQEKEKDDHFSVFILDTKRTSRERCTDITFMRDLVVLVTCVCGHCVWLMPGITLDCSSTLCIEAGVVSPSKPELTDMAPHASSGDFLSLCLVRLELQVSRHHHRIGPGDSTPVLTLSRQAV